MVSSLLYVSIIYKLTTVLSSVSLIINLLFYFLITTRWRLTETIHWYVCNFVVSEIIRSLATLMRNIIQKQLDILRERAFSATDNVAKDLENQLNSREVLYTAISVCTSTTMLFGLISLVTFCNRLKNPYIVQRFDKYCAIVSGAIWSVAICYFATFSNFRIQSILDYDKYDNIFSIIFIIIFFAFGIYVCWIGAKLIFDRIESKNNSDTLIAARRRNAMKVYCCMVILIVLFAIGAMNLFVNVAQLMKTLKINRIYQRIVDDANTLCVFILGIVWPFIWIALDSAFAQELQKIKFWLKNRNEKFFFQYKCKTGRPA